MGTKQIYTKRYPGVDAVYVSKLDGEETRKLSPLEKAEILCDESMQVYSERFSIVPKGRDDEKERFIAYSKEISEAYQISIDIFESPICLRTHLYFPICDINGELKEILQRLIVLSDGLSVLGGRDNETVLFGFTFDTCDVYIDGRKM